jgi:hypothetical protein
MNFYFRGLTLYCQAGLPVGVQVAESPQPAAQLLVGPVQEDVGAPRDTEAAHRRTGHETTVCHLLIRLVRK